MDFELCSGCQWELIKSVPPREIAPVDTVPCSMCEKHIEDVFLEEHLVFHCRIEHPLSFTRQLSIGDPWGTQPTGQLWPSNTLYKFKTQLDPGPSLLLDWNTKKELW